MQVMREDLVKQATGKAATYCAKRERTAQDVYAYLARYGLNRFWFNKRGRNIIRHALRAKQIPEAYIEAGASTLPEAEYRQTALDLLKEKYRTLGNIPELEKKAKAVRFMVGKGYEADFIYDLLNDLPA